MPFYSVLIEGENLNIPSESGGPPITGFFTSRVEWADSKSKAESKALDSVKRLWSNGRYAAQASAASLLLSVSESAPSTFWQWLVAPNNGHAFFAEEDNSDN